MHPQTHWCLAEHFSNVVHICQSMGGENGKERQRIRGGWSRALKIVYSPAHTSLPSNSNYKAKIRPWNSHTLTINKSIWIFLYSMRLDSFIYFFKCWLHAHRRVFCVFSWINWYAIAMRSQQNREIYHLPFLVAIRFCCSYATRFKPFGPFSAKCERKRDARCIWPYYAS